jgi:hypothetical protein
MVSEAAATLVSGRSRLSDSINVARRWQAQQMTGDTNQGKYLPFPSEARAKLAPLLKRTRERGPERS